MRRRHGARNARGTFLRNLLHQLHDEGYKAEEAWDALATMSNEIGDLREKVLNGEPNEAEMSRLSMLEFNQDTLLYLAKNMERLER